MLTRAQKKHFDTFGFLVLRRVFSATEIDQIRQESEALLADNRKSLENDDKR